MADIGTKLNPAFSPIGSAPLQERTKSTPGAAGFKEALNQLTRSAAETSKTDAPALKFSNHAVERMKLRGISYSPEVLNRIERAIDKAAAKGSRETLLLAEDSAMIVSVNNRTVVTVMDKNSLKENVFTNIDSTVVI